MRRWCKSTPSWGAQENRPNPQLPPPNLSAPHTTSTNEQLLPGQDEGAEEGMYVPSTSLSPLLSPHPCINYDQHTDQPTSPPPCVSDSRRINNNVTLIDTPQPFISKQTVFLKVLRAPAGPSPESILPSITVTKPTWIEESVGVYGSLPLSRSSPPSRNQQTFPVKSNRI